MKKELNAGTEVDSNSTADILPSASLAQNPVLPAANLIRYGFILTDGLYRYEYGAYAFYINHQDDKKYQHIQVSRSDKEHSVSQSVGRLVKDIYDVHNFIKSFTD